MKRLFLSLLVLVLLLTGCGNKKPAKETVEKTPSDTQTGEPTPMHATDDDLFIANAHYTSETLPFSLPGSDFLLRGGNLQFRLYVYNGSTDEKIAAYFQQLEQEGFARRERNRNTALAREDCIINVNYGTESLGQESFTIYFYVQRPPLPEGALTQQQAQEIMGSENLPIDITPDGLFQRSGCQIFARLASANEPFFFRTYMVDPSGAWPLNDMEPVAVTDLDENGIDEVWTVGYGGTSGIFTFYARAVENGEVKYTKTVGPVNTYKLSFDGESGYLRIRGENAEEEVYFDLDISGGELELIKDGEPLPA